MRMVYEKDIINFDNLMETENDNKAAARSLTQRLKIKNFGKHKGNKKGDKITLLEEEKK